MGFLDKMGAMRKRAESGRRWMGPIGRVLLGLWARSCRMTVIGDGPYQELRRRGVPVVTLVWHGRIFLIPYFFRGRGVMPLVSPSGDGEIAAQIMDGWGYKLLRGSGSHVMVGAWKAMLKELRSGGEVIIVPDGPRGPDRVFKPGGLKLARETGARLVPWTFSTDRKKYLRSWDKFLMFYPFRRIVVMFGVPIEIPPGLSDEDLEKERLRLQALLRDLDRRADEYFD
jgi:lysophospholipid acyltransferase (LPLAT)-like uncharacterized protein